MPVELARPIRFKIVARNDRASDQRMESSSSLRARRQKLFDFGGELVDFLGLPFPLLIQLTLPVIQAVLRQRANVKISERALTNGLMPAQYVLEIGTLVGQKLTDLFLLIGAIKTYADR